MGFSVDHHSDTTWNFCHNLQCNVCWILSLGTKQRNVCTSPIVRHSVYKTKPDEHCIMRHCYTSNDNVLHGNILSDLTNLLMQVLYSRLGLVVEHYSELVYTERSINRSLNPKLHGAPDIGLILSQSSNRNKFTSSPLCALFQYTVYVLLNTTDMTKLFWPFVKV